MRAYLAGAVTGLAVLMTAGPAQAQPAVYRVVNVDSHDVLNVRRTPSPTSALVGSLPPGASRIEVLETRLPELLKIPSSNINRGYQPMGPGLYVVV